MKDGEKGFEKNRGELRRDKDGKPYMHPIKQRIVGYLFDGVMYDTLVEAYLHWPIPSGMRPVEILEDVKE